MQKITLRRIFHYYWIHAKKYPKSGVAVVLLYLIAGAVSTVLSPIIYKHIIDAVSLGVQDGTEIAIRYVFILGIVVFSHNLLYRVADFMNSYFTSNVLKELADDAFKRIHGHSYAFFVNRFSGSIIAKVKRYINGFQTIYGNILWNGLYSLVQVGGPVAVLFIIVPTIGVAYLIWIIVFVIFSIFLTKKKMPYDLVEAEMDSKTIAQLSDTVTNALTIKMFASKIREFFLFRGITYEWEQKRRVAAYRMDIQKTILGTLYILLEFVAMYIAIRMWASGAITVGTIVLIQMYVIGTFRAVWQFGIALADVEKSLADAREMVEIFEEKPSVRDVAHPEKCRIQSGEIEFQNVSFQYENKQQYVLSDFSLQIKPGEKIGLVGHSGAGKTTITKILLRFSDISNGKVLIDGQDIRKIKQDDLRRNISYVPQEPMLFHRSLKENIAYGKPNASMKEIVAVAKKAHAHEFIEKLPKGYNTLVGERGVKLSGGERQRVAIARAMLKNAPILILDEATSSLDSVSERHIQEALDELMKGRTTIVVAHRLSTIQKMDRIIVIEDGDIVEEGRHEELLALKSVYANFWQQQSGAFLQE